LDAATFSQSASYGSGSVGEKLQQIISVKDQPYGAKGDGVTDDTAAALAGSAALSAAGGGALVFPGPGPYLFGSTVALTSAHANVCWRLEGATIKKGFNGDLVTVTNCTNFSVDGVGIIDGQMATGPFTGKGFVLSGSGSSYFYMGSGILTKAFAGSHVEYGADAGFSTKLMCDMLADASQLTPTMITCTGADSSAMQRSFWGRVIGTISLTGAISTVVRCSLINQVSISSTCNVTLVSGTTWSNNGNPITIDGLNTIIMGCRMAGSVTINATATGMYVGNHRTAGTFTNNATVNMLVIGDDFITFPLGSSSAPGLIPIANQNTGFWQRVANVITFSGNGNDVIELQPSAMAYGKDMLVKWGDAATISAVGAFDTGASRKAAGVLEVNNGTAGTTQSIKAYQVTDADALQTACLLRAGTGAPNNANGANGDIYFRSDGGALSTVYQKRTGAWVGIV
jgi:hypothetical protein